VFRFRARGLRLGFRFRVRVQGLGSGLGLGFRATSSKGGGRGDGEGGEGKDVDEPKNKRQRKTRHKVRAALNENKNKVIYRDKVKWCEERDGMGGGGGKSQRDTRRTKVLGGWKRSGRDGCKPNKEPWQNKQGNKFKRRGERGEVERDRRGGEWRGTQEKKAKLTRQKQDSGGRK
jgi:hypothetical protein